MGREDGRDKEKEEGGHCSEVNTTVWLVKTSIALLREKSQDYQKRQLPLNLALIEKLSDGTRVSTLVVNMQI